MKFFILFASVALSVSAFAKTVCTGKVQIHTSFIGTLDRDATLTITPGLAELQKGAVSEVSTDVGEDPIVYKGTVDATGVKAQTMTDPNNGDIYTFQIKVVSLQNILVQATFMNSDHEVQAQVPASSLVCHEN